MLFSTAVLLLILSLLFHIILLERIKVQARFWFITSHLTLLLLVDVDAVVMMLLFTMDGLTVETNWSSGTKWILNLRLTFASVHDYVQCYWVLIYDANQPLEGVCHSNLPQVHAGDESKSDCTLNRWSFNVITSSSNTNVSIIIKKIRSITSNNLQRIFTKNWIWIGWTSGAEFTHLMQAHKCVESFSCCHCHLCVVLLQDQHVKHQLDGHD